MKLSNGKILVATPELLMDHIFNQGVLLLAEHNDNGSMAFMLNKPLILRLNDVFPEIPSNIQLWNGGPVETSNLFYIHNVPELIPDGILFDDSKDLYIGGDFNHIKDLLNKDLLDESNIRFFLGYSGWAPGQLEDEIKQKAWFVTQNDFNIFDLNPRNIWKEKIVAINPENVIWKNAPLNPNLN